MFKNTHWLEITEFGVVILTVIGIIVAVVSQQLIYALILLTILMLVNILNRRRLEQVIRRHNRNRTVQLDELKAAVNNFSQSLNQPANPNLLSPDQVSALLVSIRTLQDGQQTLAQAIAPMQNQIYKLIADFHDRPELKETEDLAQIILALQNSLNQFPALGSIEQRITHIEEILNSEEQI